MSERLKVGRDAIFLEYRKAIQSSRLRKQAPETQSDDEPVSKMEPFTPIELLAWYIFRYTLLDLFFREFRYTLDDLSSERDFSLLFHILSGKEFDPEDDERIKIIILSIEETHPDEDQASVEKATIDLIKQLHRILILTERSRALSALSVDSDDYRRLNATLIQKARSLGLSQSIFNS